MCLVHSGIHHELGNNWVILKSEWSNSELKMSHSQTLINDNSSFFMFPAILMFQLKLPSFCYFPWWSLAVESVCVIPNWSLASTWTCYQAGSFISLYNLFPRDSLACGVWRGKFGLGSHCWSKYWHQSVLNLLSNTSVQWRLSFMSCISGVGNSRP